MTRSTTLVAAAALGLMTSFSVSAADLSAVPSGDYAVDKTHAYINFSYNHLGLSNPTLSFDQFDVNMVLDADEPTNTTVEVSIDGNSVVTGSEVFHDHLTGAKWFDTAAHPTMMFKSTGVTANDDGTYAMTGDLTIKDMTKPVTLTVTINAATMHPMAKKPVVGIDATGQILRSDWGLGANAPFVSDEVTLSITAEMLAAS